MPEGETHGNRGRKSECGRKDTQEDLTEGRLERWESGSRVFRMSHAHGSDENGMLGVI